MKTRVGALAAVFFFGCAHGVMVPGELDEGDTTASGVQVGGGEGGVSNGSGNSTTTIRSWSHVPSSAVTEFPRTR